MESLRDGGIRDFIKARIVGLCMAHNRLLGFRIVRNTRPVQFTPPEFIPARENRTLRDPEHLAKINNYPDPHFYLNHVGKYRQLRMQNPVHASGVIAGRAIFLAQWWKQIYFV